MRRPTPRPHAIGFAEVPDFHVAVARRARPDLQDQPVLVGGDPGKRGKVLASSADLQTLGIEPGMPLGEAIDRAPGAALIKTNMDEARDVAGLLRASMRREVEALELDGLGGFYLEAPHGPAAALELAETLAERVHDSTALSLRVGIAPVRFAARLVAEDAGEGGARVISDEELDGYLAGQPIERFPGVGPKTAARLAELGAPDVPSLRELGLERLEVLLGNHGRSLWMLACGEDPKPLRVRRHPTTLSRERSLADRIGDASALTERLDELADNLGQALRREGLTASRIALRLTLDQGRTATRSLTLASRDSTEAGLRTAARALLDRVRAESGAAGKVGLVLAGLELQGTEDRQLGLF